MLDTINELNRVDDLFISILRIAWWSFIVNPFKDLLVKTILFAQVELFEELNILFFFFIMFIIFFWTVGFLLPSYDLIIN